MEKSRKLLLEREKRQNEEDKYKKIKIDDNTKGQNLLEKIKLLENELKIEKAKNESLSLSLNELKKELEKEKIKNKEYEQKLKIIDSKESLFNKILEKDEEIKELKTKII